MTDTDTYASRLAGLVRALSCNDLDEHEVERIVGICLEAREKPAETLKANYGADAEKVAQYEPAGVTAFIIFIELEDYFAVADTVDELYEQIIDAFENPALPEYPYDNSTFETLSDFYRWVDGQLQLHHGKYSLLAFGESYTHDFQVILVFREEMANILSLCRELGLAAEPCN